jgi:hypothetical protein
MRRILAGEPVGTEISNTVTSTLADHASANEP